MILRIVFCLFLQITFCSLHFSQHSVARQWNEELLEAIRKDFARPTVHARNLFHTSFGMYDAWAVYDSIATPFLLGKTVGPFHCDFNGISKPADLKSAREEAISYAAYRILRERFKNSPNVFFTYTAIDNLMAELGFNKNFTSTNYSNGSPAALGNYIAQCVLNFGLEDGSNEKLGYNNLFYQPVNPPLVMKRPGNPDILDYNRWQPLTLDIFIDQSGNEIPFDTPPFLSPEWGVVTPFALDSEDLTIYSRNGDDYWVYHDPGNPPFLDTTSVGGISEEYKWGFALVAIWSSQLDPNNSPLIDISPASIGNIKSLPKNIEGYREFYNLFEGGDPSVGHTVNPITGEAYEPQIVPLADYTRVLAEFWADGPASETPPGHWFTILNYVNDHPLFEKRFKGQGEILEDLEWDVKAYFLLGGTMHDAAVTSWGIKGWYDYIRPVSAIRGMAELGQSSNPNMPSYHPGGIPLIPRYIELVKAGDPLVGDNDENLNKIKLFAWRGPDFIQDPETDFAGVDWILAENWWPYQRPSFVTPPFAGYISGHSTYSRSAAEVMTLLTGDPFFPGGIGEFVAKKDSFLVFEDGPSVDVVLQWATYRDASDQTSLSRLWGGIHPPADDIPGRLIGIDIGNEAFAKAESYFFLDEDEDGYYHFEDCDDLNAEINPGASETCDEIDNDCNGLIDDQISIYTYYFDEDGDGFGNPETSLDTCSNVIPSGYVEIGSDCDDLDSSIHPGMLETCDTIDNNCDGQVNEGITLFVYYFDSDGDGFGDENEFIITCSEISPVGYINVAADCDDLDASINPGVSEICDGIDNNCNGVIDEELTLYQYYMDSDQDGYGDPDNLLETCSEEVPDGFVVDGTDCDDQEFYTNPGSIELNDGKDNDCNGEIDDNVSSINEYELTGIRIFPNPIRDQLTIEVNDHAVSYLKIVFPDGREKIYNRGLAAENSEIIQMQGLPSGVYILLFEIEGKEEVWIEKVIKI